MGLNLLVEGTANWVSRVKPLPGGRVRNFIALAVNHRGRSC